MPDTIRTADRIRGVIAEHLGVPLEKATDEADLIDDLGADSLDVIEISIALDEALGVETHDDDTDKWRTVGDVVACIEAKR